jgi:hypothetical protein
MLKKITPRMWVIGVVVLVAAALAVLSYRVAAAGTLLVSGNTSAGENQPGWMFNRGVSEATPYSFTFNAHSLGLGSLYVGPSANANDVFQAELFPGKVLVSDFNSFSYDFVLGQGGDSADADQFVTRVYANIDDSANNFDCRYDYAARTASQTSFVKPIVFPGMAPSFIEKGSDRIAECPPLLEGMPEGSHIRAVALTMGTVGNDDTGLDAYFDNVELVVASDPTSYNFEAAPRTQADCAEKKWQQYKFRNQGQCLKFVDKGIDTR